MDDSLLEDPATDGADLLAALQDGDEDARRDVRSLVRPAAEQLAADDAEAVGGDGRLDDRAEVGAAVFDVLVDGEQEAAEVFARLKILRREEDVGFILRFLSEVEETQHVGDDLAAWRIARDAFHQSEGRGRLHRETVDGIEVAHRQAYEVEDRPRVFRDVRGEDSEEAQTVEAIDQEVVVEAVRESRCDVLEECVRMIPAVQLVDLTEVVQAKADE